ncbi:MAG: HAMP domain-containing sensor histidine kinase, partial [Anaerolineae bacterium]
GFFPLVLVQLVIALVLLHRRRLRWVMYILMGGVWLAITLIGVTFNGVLNGIMILYCVLIILAAIFFQPRTVLIWSVLVSATVVLLGLGQSTGVIPLNDVPISVGARVFYLLMVFNMGGIFLASASQVVRRSIERARVDEAALRERNQQLEHEIHERQQVEARERELMLAQARSKLQADFFNTLSHDLKTPLATIMTSLYLLQRERSEEQRARRIEHISKQVDLIDRYVQEMLMLTRLEAAPPTSMGEVALPELVEQVLTSLQPRVEEKALTLAVSAAPNLPTVVGDRDQLHRLLLNLLENAINYTPAHQSISVTMQPSDQAVQLTIRDSGIGIEPDELPHIFEPFYRTESARAVERRGTGLGLAIVKKIADVHGILIDVQSRVGDGTIFMLRLPAALGSGG